MISDCENTTNWTNYASNSMAITNQAVSTTSPPDLDYKEPGSNVIQATGTADGSGNFQIVYTMAATNFSGAASSEFAASWLQYFSLWIKSSQTGTFKIQLVDAANKQAYWNQSVTASVNKYYNNTIGTYVGNDSGFDITNITTVRLGYTGMAASAAATFRVDGLRVQGDPTFDSLYWTTMPIDDLMQKESTTGVVPLSIVAVAPPKTYPTRRRGYSNKQAEEPDPVTIGATPVTAIDRPIRLAYQLIADQSSNKSEGKMRYLRDNLYFELRRIVLRNPTAVSGVNYLYYLAHAEDDNYVSRPPRAKGYLDLRAEIWRNING